MNKANYSDIKYDPELPFALVYSDEDETTVTSRFIERGDAESWLKYNNYVNTRVVDTTPKPKIPEDADYLIWEFEGETNMAYRDDNDWYASGEWWTTRDLEEALKDAEVTVLVRKEDS